MTKQLIGMLLGILSFLSIPEAHAQRPTEFPRTFEIQFNPTSFFNRRPRLRVGFEYQFPKHWGVATTFAWGNETLHDIGIWSGPRLGNNYQYREIRPEIRFYLIRDAGFAGYISFEPHWVRTNSTLIEGRYSDPIEPGVDWLFDRVDYQLEKFGGQLKAGLKFTVFDRFTVGGYVGYLGLTERTVSYDDPVNLRVDDREFPFGRGVWEQVESFRSPGTDLIYDFSIGLQIGYMFIKD
ncbi:hypothetical protein [Pontibacter sp. G13]|uniref:hypothetical protein n=1 Tax=Pontibacter sp. G13 TaxID=3074898 RepID=UPI0028890FDB|nr:hypothetical protein [Pontibacter sp. G13]WNJ17694.1 hypothetical protein RJD25_22815 [Pontibacter sp. G13]